MTTQIRDVVIVGGGIVGCLTAYFLAQQGLSVTILEKDSVGSHASGFAFGEMGAVEGAGIPDPLLDFSLWSLWRHESLSQELKDVSGVDNEFRFTNRLTLAFNEANVNHIKEQLVWQEKAPGLQVGWLEPAEVIEVEPMANPACLGALYVQGAGSVEPYRHTLAAAQAGEKLGVDFLLRRVTGLITQGDRCQGVTYEGGRLEADTVVLTTGPWSQEASGWARINIPVRPLKGQILRLENPASPINTSMYWNGSYVATKSDGLTWAGTTEEEVGFDEEVTPQARDSIMKDLLQMAPTLTEARLAQHTACLRPLSADGLPIVGLAPGWQNLYIGTGAGRKGILWSTGITQGLSELILEGRTDVPGIKFLDPARFSAD